MCLNAYNSIISKMSITRWKNSNWMNFTWNDKQWNSTTFYYELNDNLVKIENLFKCEIIIFKLNTCI